MAILGIPIQCTRRANRGLNASSVGAGIRGARLFKLTSRISTDGSRAIRYFARASKGLRGKKLGCFCRPAKGFGGKLLCHGQVIAAYLDGIKPEEVG